MPVEAIPGVRTRHTPVGFWTLLTGGSIGIVAGFAIDLLRLCLYWTRQSLAAIWCPAGAALPVTGRCPPQKPFARRTPRRSQGTPRRWLGCTGSAAR